MARAFDDGADQHLEYTGASDISVGIVGAVDDFIAVTTATDLEA